MMSDQEDFYNMSNHGCLADVVMVIIIAILICLSSCRSTSKVSETSTSVATEIHQETKDSVQDEAKESRTETTITQITDSVEGSTLKIWWSEPDSTGTQYKLVSEESRWKTQTKTQTQTQTSESKESKESKISVTKQDSTKQESTQVTKETKKQVSTLRSVICLVICGLLAYAIVWCLKKFLEDK